MASRRRRGPIELATASLVRSLSDDESPAQKALGAMAVNLAATLDAGAGLATAAVNRELRETIKAMTTGGDTGDGDPQTAALVALLSSPVGHAEG